MVILEWASIIPLLIGIAMFLKTVVYDLIVWKTMSEEEKKGYSGRVVISIVAIVLGVFVYLMIGKGMI